MTAPKRPQITSKDVEPQPIIERDLSSDLYDDDVAVKPASVLDDRMKAILLEEKRLRAFMEEPVTFMVQESADKNAVNPVPCGVNGVTKFFQRGQEYTVARKFVESLLKVSWSVQTVNYKDSDGVDQTKINYVPALVYQIAILHDPSGMGPNDDGRRWFMHQQRNG
jgi:hypothetical protein